MVTVKLADDILVVVLMIRVKKAKSAMAGDDFSDICSIQETNAMAARRMKSRHLPYQSLKLGDV